MVNCSIRNCKNRSEKGGEVRFFSFPKDETAANAWLPLCKPKANIRTSRVCSLHFTPSDYLKTLRQILMNETPKRCRVLKPDAVPSLNLFDPTQTSSITLKKKATSEKIGNNQTPSKIEGTEKRPDNCTDDYILIEVPPEKQTEEINTCPDECEATTESPSSIPATISGAEYKTLVSNNKKYQVLIKNLKEIFTPGQLRSLHKPDKGRVRWCDEDIAAALALNVISPTGYWYMKGNLGIPLPAFSTLRKWASKFKIEEGVLSQNESEDKELSSDEETVQTDPPTHMEST